MAIEQIGQKVSAAPQYQCGNCGRMIGAMEQIHLWNDSVVCAGCRETLEKQLPRQDKLKGTRLCMMILALLAMLMALAFAANRRFEAEISSVHIAEFFGLLWLVFWVASMVIRAVK